MKHFDRIADHFTITVESIYFMINANTIKHQKVVDKK
jgi:phosphate transport system protein